MFGFVFSSINYFTLSTLIYAIKILVLRCNCDGSNEICATVQPKKKSNDAPSRHNIKLDEN